MADCITCVWPPLKYKFWGDIIHNTYEIDTYTYVCMYVCMYIDRQTYIYLQDTYIIAFVGVTIRIHTNTHKNT